MKLNIANMPYNKESEKLVHRPDIWFVTTSGASGGGGVLHTTALLQAASVLFKERLCIIGRNELRTIPMPYTPGRFVSVPLRSAWQKAWWLATGRCYDLMSPFLDNWLTGIQHKPRLVFLDRSRIGRFAPRFEALGVPVITMHHNVEADYVHSTETTPLIRSLLLHIVKTAEKQALMHSSINLSMTSHDTDRLRKFHAIDSGVAIETLGTFETIDTPPPPLLVDTLPMSRPWHIVITGSLCDYQTIDGIHWFLQNIHPKLKSSAPGLQITIAGRSPTPGILDLARKAGVSILSNPANMDIITQQADIYLGPTRLGSGLKLRLKDGLRMGLPIVAHSVSARGYRELIPDPLFQSFDTPDECVSALLRLLPLLPLDLATRRDIQHRYLEQFSFSAGLARLQRILEAHLPASECPWLQHTGHYPHLN